MLQQLTYLHSGRRDHVLICDDFKASSTIAKLPPELLVGYFEAPALMDAAGDEARKFSVGFSTVRAVEDLQTSKKDKKRCWQMGWEEPLSVSDRKLSVVDCSSMFGMCRAIKSNTLQIMWTSSTLHDERHESFAFLLHGVVSPLLADLTPQRSLVVDEEVAHVLNFNPEIEDFSPCLT